MTGAGHWPILPLLLPALGGAGLLLLPATLRRRAGLVTLIATLAAAVALVLLTGGGDRLVYRLGGWPAPFGIVLVADRLSAAMVALAAAVVLAAYLHAWITGGDREENGAGGDPAGGGRHFHALVLFQIFGLNGAFLTGDAFNLFVFFEVMLIASYGLMVQGGGAGRLRAAFGYVVANLAASALFLVALGTLYAVTGTLNMADLAARAMVMPGEDAAFLRLGVALLFLVFAFKAALVPMQAWLPAAYARAPGAAAAVFTLLTKVGAYALLRMGALLEPSGLTAAMAPWLAVAGGVTLAFGAAGILGTGGRAPGEEGPDLGRLAAFAVIASMGTLVLTLSFGTQAAVGATVFYLVQSTLAAALLFLLAERLGRGAGRGMAGWLYLGVALAMTGLPPLSGFPAKLMILGATSGSALAWAVILATTFLSVAGFARAGSAMFLEGRAAPVLPARTLAVPGAILAVLVLYTLAAGPLADWAAAVAAQLADPLGYIAAVLP